MICGDKGPDLLFAGELEQWAWLNYDRLRRNSEQLRKSGSAHVNCLFRLDELRLRQGKLRSRARSVCAGAQLVTNQDLDGIVQHGCAINGRFCRGHSLLSSENSKKYVSGRGCDLEF